jgi:hypothetical protein
MSGTVAAMTSYGAAGTSYLPQTTTYITATGYSFTTAQKGYLNRWFGDLTGVANGSYATANILGNFVCVYPFVTGTFAADKINASNPGTNNCTDTGSPTYSTSNLTVAYNGSSQFSDTGFNPNNHVDPTTFSGMMVHRRDTNDDSNATYGVVSSGSSYGIIRSDTNRQTFIATNRSDASTGSSAVANLWSSTYSSATVLNAYKNGSNIKANTGLTFNNTGNQTLYIGAFHGGSGASYGGANTVDFFAVTKGNWSDSDNLLVYNATKALKSSFGVTWT